MTTARVPRLTKRTAIYKHVGELDIAADVYTLGDLAGEPTIVWLHGGALIMEHRDTVPPWLLDACAERNWALVSFDYRLAPETKLAGIAADVDDAFRWLSGAGEEPSPGVPGPIAVIGGSAGGYLALLAGFRVRSRLAAVVSLWGYGELTGAWYSRPSHHAVHHQITLSREEALREVSGPPIADDRSREGNGWAFYQYCRQQGRWPIEVAGWDPDHARDRFSPYMPIDNVSAHHPPTLLIHGDRDTDVPYEQSVMMAAAFEEHGVEHHLRRVAGAEHGLADVDEVTIHEVYAEATSFLQTHLERAG